jgi:2-methylcitrate dehydratase PrpD
VPAALAAAEVAAATGEQLLRGIVAGYEAVSRLGAAGPPEIVARRFRPIAVMGPFGAAAAAGTVAGITLAHLEASLAVAANMSGGISQGFIDGTMEPFFHAGFAASNGLFAVQLARAGAIVSPRTLEGPFGLFATLGGAEGDLAALTAPREQLAVCGIGTKRFASCVQNQATLELILAQVEPLDADAVERVVLRRPARGTDGLNSPAVDSPPPYDSMLQRQMSARYTAAAGLLGRPVEQPSSFADRDDDAARLAERIELDPAGDSGIALEVSLHDGRRIDFRGEGSRVLFPDNAEIRSRFLARAEPVLGAAAAADVAAFVDELERVDRLADLTNLLTRGA